MDSDRRDDLRDRFRTYGVALVSQDTTEETQRDVRIRSAVLSLLFPVVLGRQPDWREIDVTEIRAALQIAISKEPEGSRIARHMMAVLELVT
jgi:hypothetical protein